MKLFKHYWKEEYLVIFLILFSLALSIFPTLYYVSKAGDNTVFPLIHNNHPDYYSNLHFMRQGFDGKWLLTSRFNPEKFQPQLVQTSLALLGKIAWLTGLDLPLVYTLARIFLGAAILLSIYLLVKLLYQDTTTRLLALFFAYLGTSFWWLSGKEKIFTYPIGYWTELNTVDRITFLPHHLAGTLFVLLSIFTLARLEKQLPRSKTKTSGVKMLVEYWRVLIPAFFAALAGFVNPASLINYYFTLLVFFVLWTIKTIFLTSGVLSTPGVSWSVIASRIKKNFFSPIIFTLSITVLLSLIPLIHLYRVSHSTFPWTSYRDWEAKQIYPVTFTDYILVLGPAFVFAFFAIKKFWLKKDPLSLLILSWFFAPFLPLFTLKKFFIDVFPVANMRFLQAYHYIPVGLLAGGGFTKKTKWLVNKLKVPAKYFILAIFLPVFLYSTGYWYLSIKQEISLWQPNIYNIYLPKDFLAAFDFLNKNSAEESVVLAGGFLGNIIPAFTHNRTFLGHPVVTYKFAEKEKLLNRFFKQDDQKFAQRLIKEYGIDYIFYSLDTSAPDTSFIDSIGLKLVYKNKQVAIYQSK